MSPPPTTSTEAWPDPAARAGTRARRRGRVRAALGIAVAVGALGFVRSLDLVDARGVTLVAGSLLTIVFVRRLVIREASGQPGPFTRALAERHDPPATNRLTNLERSLDLATISAGDAQHILRPLVVDIAATWLQGAHGLDLEDAGARALLPRDVWVFAAPTSRRPDDPHAPGITLAALDALIADLETLR